MNVNGRSISFACLSFVALLGQGKQPTAAVTCDKGNVVYAAGASRSRDARGSGRGRAPPAAGSAACACVWRAEGSSKARRPPSRPRTHACRLSPCTRAAALRVRPGRR